MIAFLDKLIGVEEVVVVRMLLTPTWYDGVFEVPLKLAVEIEIASDSKLQEQMKVPTKGSLAIPDPNWLFRLKELQAQGAEDNTVA